MTPVLATQYASLVADTAPPRELNAYAVGFAHGSVSAAIRYLEAGRADWALDELRRAMKPLNAAISPELRSAGLQGKDNNRG